MNKIFACILFINAILVLFPALIFDMPVAQTDGASHYAYAKVFSETWDIDAKNPEYNKIGSVENKLSDYPPLVTVVFGSMLALFGNDIFLVNGGFGLAFFLIASASFYLLTKELTRTAQLL